MEGELTTGKQLTRVFNGLVEENTTEDTAMTNTINFDDLLLEETVFVSTSIAPMDMIEEEENLMIEKNTVPLSEDTTNIMEMIENAAFDFTLPEPLPTIAEIRQQVQRSLKTLRQDHKRSLNPTPYKVTLLLGWHNF